jgi:tRNA(Ile)-lysidine synthase
MPPVPRSGPRSIDWPAVADTLGARFPVESWHPRVAQWLRRRRRAEPRWAIAFSGGPDSLALLLLLWIAFPERRREWIVLHFNHRLRGAEADADARFCRGVCRHLGLRFRTRAWRRPAGPVSEAQAREARFLFFRNALAQERAVALWLGHQANDVAESMLMRLARGSGLDGLCAPRPVQSAGAGWVHLRPLLGIPRATLEEALRQAGAGWREDSTNAGELYLRNRFRKNVLPSWQAASAPRDALGGATHARDLLEEDAEALEGWLDQAKVLRGRCLDLHGLRSLPRALRRRALHRWRLALGERAGDLSLRGFERLLGLIEQGGAVRFSLGATGFAVGDEATLRFVEAPRKR